ncbi:MAG: FAD synthetase family protein [Rikenellaceae bacterium]
MKIHNTSDFTIKNPVVTIGSFDGLHLGHLSIIDALKKKAKEICGETVIVTFSPHPRIVLNHDADNLFFLNSLEEKCHLLEKVGIDHLIILPFDKELSTKTMEEFFVLYLKNTLHAKALIVGYNHRFGSDRNCDYDTLRELGEREQIEIVRVEKKGIDERDISSTTIRNLLKRGDLKHANNYLPHPYFFLSDIDSTGLALYYQPKKLYPPQGKYCIELEYNGSSIHTTATITKSNAIIIEGIDHEIKGAKIYFLT